ncbi:MAG: hypothetical protein M3Q57_09630 [Pseudomonadota bacterium]|nr:hypothetical protein [Pseudomonadota bacterium]
MIAKHNQITAMKQIHPDQCRIWKARPQRMGQDSEIENGRETRRWRFRGAIKRARKEADAKSILGHDDITISGQYTPSPTRPQGKAIGDVRPEARSRRTGINQTFDNLDLICIWSDQRGQYRDRQYEPLTLMPPTEFSHSNRGRD